MRQTKRKAENGEPITFLDRLSAWGGPLSLVISLVSSGYTAYTIEFVQPREAKHARLEAAIDSINAINRDAQAKWLGTTDGDKRILITQAAQLQKIGFIDEAEKDAAAISSDVTSYQYYFLGNEEAQEGRFDAAYKYLELAIARETDPIVKVNLKVQGAKLHLSQEGANGINDARTRFKEADTAYAKLPSTNIQRSMLYAEMAIAEATFGECSELAHDVDQFSNQVAMEKVSLSGVANTRGYLYRALSAQNRCPWEQSKVSGN